MLVLAAPLLHLRGSIWAGSLLRKDLVLALLGAATLAYLAAVRLVLRAAPRSAGWVVAVAVVLRLGLLATPPFMSSDIYRYVWDGRVQAAGINPYFYVPADSALSGLRDGAIYPNINRPDYARTIYPPAAELLFGAVGAVNQSVFATKLMLLVLEACGMAALWHILGRTRLPRARLLIYAWNPLAVWSVAADGHVDGAAIGLLGLALLARLVGRQGLSGALLAGAILTKFLPAAIGPALWRRGDWRMPAVCLVVMAALYGCYIGAGWRVLGFLPAYTSEEGLRQGSGFWALGLLGRLVDPPRLVTPLYLAACILALCGASAWMAFRQPEAADFRGEATRICGNIGLLSAGTVAAMSPHYPWYYAWLALPCCVRPRRSVIFLSCAPLLLYCDPFHDDILFPTLVFVPALVLVAADLRWPIRADADAAA